MANNRMFLTCKICGEKICIGKYYPSDGWTLKVSSEHDIRIQDSWLKKHTYCDKKDDLTGNEEVFILEYEGQ